MTLNRLAWITSKAIVFVIIVASVTHGVYILTKNLIDSGVDHYASLFIGIFYFFISLGGAFIIWNLIFRNCPSRNN